MGLIIAALIALAAGIASISSGDATDSGAAWDYGDVNCDGTVDPGDSLDILLVLAGLSDETVVAPCGADGTDGWVPGDVTCDDAVTAADVLAIAAHAADLVPETSVACPLPGDDIGAPPTDLTCDVIEVGVLEPAECRFDVGPAPVEPDVQLDTPDGVAEITLTGSSAACDSEGVCSYAKSAEIDVTFQTPGVKLITLTACVGGACAVRTVEIKII
jgi:hypothetical protein